MENQCSYHLSNGRQCSRKRSTKNSLYCWQHQSCSPPVVAPVVAPAPNDAPIEKASFTLFFDGASKGNPGPSGYGYHIISSLLTEDIKNSKHIGHQTNNIAEYTGLLSGLAKLKELITKQSVITIKGDSLLVVNQVNGVWAINKPQLIVLHKQITDMLRELRDQGHIIVISHVPREQNSVADRLASTASLLHK
jgi:ribonuclease HI